MKTIARVQCLRWFVSVAIAAGIACRPAARAPDAGARADVAVRVARVLDVKTGQYSGPSVVLITGGRITRIIAQDRFDARGAGSMIELGDLTLLPGLIDAHVHLAIGGPVRANARADVQAGFTTVADQGALTHRLLALADSINAGHIEGPRVLAAGVWVGTKGGVCEFSGIGIAGAADAFVERVRQNITAGAHLTKLCLSSWPAAAFAAPDSVEIPRDVIRAVVTASHAAGRRVTAHAIGRGAARAALDGGVDGLVHTAYVDEPLGRAMRERGMWMSPTLRTLTAIDTTAVHARALVEAMRTAHRAGVTLVFGTDGGVLPHGRGVDEMETLVGAGLTPIDVIRAATVNAASALGIADSVGTIAAGMSADLMAVRGDPLRDIAALRQPAFVMLRGRALVGPH